MNVQKATRSLDTRIQARLQEHGQGWCFTPTAFLDLASQDVVWVALSRLAKKGTIRRLARGVYDFPRRHSKFDALPPDPDTVAQALASRDALRLQASAAHAANLLGFSSQVPARVVFLTDGPTRHVKVGRREIVLKNTTPRNMATAGRISGTVIQALRFIGEQQVNAGHIEHLKNLLNPEEKAQLTKDSVYAPGWMRPIISAIAGGSRPAASQERTTP